MTPTAAKRLRTVLVILGSLVLLVSLADSFTVEVPTTQKVGQFTSSGLEFDLRPQSHRPYHFVVGVPGIRDKAPSFRGVLELRGPEGRTESIPITSDTVQACNWLHDSTTSGFILAWTAPQQFSEILRRGAVYHVRISVTESLPNGCSLWFSSMKHVRLITQRSA